MTQAYLGVGGNVGDTYVFLMQAIKKISDLQGVIGLKRSRFYQTTPVSPIPQRDFINGACCFETTYTAHELLTHLKQIEKEIGKTPKLKEAPRVIDLDILFFGEEVHDDEVCHIPHPRWEERLFVLTPLADLVEELQIPDTNGRTQRIYLPTLIKNHKNPNQETITLLEEQELCTLSQ